MWVLWWAPGTTDPNVPVGLATVSVVPSRWQPARGWPTWKTCEDARVPQRARLARRPGEAEQAEVQATKKRNKPGATVWNTYIFRCLPDAVDPRGPKEK